jgi:hypothetical protein
MKKYIWHGILDESPIFGKGIAYCPWVLKTDCDLKALLRETLGIAREAGFKVALCRQIQAVE